ncbi:MAG: Aspartate racemase [Candidatus Woesebacteria bacterium GW2011_GWB1_39_10]|uniref:Aspartate racemase n=2 Tax=Candidatus Woeseibacteriota TaxID=1752722 RepID=A0A0G0LW55_9BACT|nr:MAG: Aspartate racemase [Candidatus Woesebacteria bacterium GW2011_GWB1_39_10]KKS91210.1 MAG: Aspartate racemase [Candidatus Woesebacteria bacterium GW2011_GWA1_43_12]
MKTAGIIGGLGPETTSQFYLEIIFSCFQANKKARPPLLIWSVPLEYQIESDLITKAEGEERYIPYLVDAAKRLENGGADFIVIPCNSVHIFIQEVRKAVKIPVLSIVEETANFLKEKNIKNIGLLATKTTIEKRIYQKPLEDGGIQITLPDQEEQEKVGTLINNLVLNRYDNKDRAELLEMIGKLSNKGVKDVVLACTDLQLLTPKHDQVNIYDSMAILANATVREILK